MGDIFGDLIASDPPTSANNGGYFEDIFDETKIVPIKPPVFGEEIQSSFSSKQDDPSFTFKFMQQIKDEVEKNVIKPFEFASGKLARGTEVAVKSTGKASVKPFQLYLEWRDKQERESVGKNILRPTLDILGRQDITSKLPEYSSISEVLNTLIPPTPSTTKLVSQPPGFSAITGQPSSGMTLQKSPTNIGDIATEVGKFSAGVGLSLLNPANLVEMGVFKGASMALKTPLAQQSMVKLSDEMLKFVPEGVQREMQLGKFKLTDEMKDIFNDRINKIESTLMRGEKILDSVSELTPAERLRLKQIRFGGISISESERSIRIREKALGNFIDILSDKVLKINEASKRLGKPLFSDEIASTIHANMGQYLPTLYKAFEGPLKPNKIPSAFLSDLWNLNDKELSHLSRLSPKAAELAMENFQRASQGPFPEASGFKPLRVKQSRVTSKVEANIANDLYDNWTQKQSELRKKANSFKLEDIGFNDVDVALLNRVGINLETLANIDTATWGGYGSIQTQMSNALGKQVSTDKFLKWVEKSKTVNTQRNKILAEVGNLEYKKRNAAFFAGAKYNIQDLAASEEDLPKLSKRLGYILGRKVDPKEANNLRVDAKNYVAGVLPDAEIGDLRNIAYDFEEYQMALGKIDEPLVLGARAISDLTLMNENARFFNVLASNPSFTLPKDMTAVAGFVKMPESKRLGALSGRYVKAQIADEINVITDFQKNFDKTSWKAMSNWKFGKTALNPATHFRNMMSNTVLLDLSGVSLSEQLRNYPEAFDAILSRNGLFKRAIKSGAISNTFFDSELRVLRKTLLEEVTEEVGMLSRVANVGTKFFDKAGTVYQTEEELAKMVKFISGLKGGLTDVEAAKQAQFWLFNYNDVPPLVRQVRSSAIGIPFITFPYKALPVIAHSLVDNPLKIMKYKYIFDAIETGSAANQGVTPEQVQFEKEILKRDSPLFTSYLRLPFQNQQGDSYHLDLTYILPWGDIGDMGNYFGIPASGQIGGLAKPLFELMLNKSVFSNKPIYGERFKNMKDLVNVATTEEGIKVGQEIYSYLIKSYAPSLFPETPFGEGGYAYERLKRSVLKEPVSLTQSQSQPLVSAALDTLMGLKTKADDVHATQVFRVKDLVKQIEVLTSEIRMASIKSEKGVIKPEELDFKIQMNTQIIEVLKQEIEKIRGEQD